MKFNFIYIKNDIYREAKADEKVSVNVSSSNDESNLDFLNLLRSCKKDIMEKRFDNISSFNFSRDVFFKGRWNELSKIARGLFLNTHNGEIVARGFDKFFNYHEGMFNTPVWLKENLQFPVTAYKKYNGFLGILSFDKETNQLLFCSKSCISGQFPNYFKKIFLDINGEKGQEYLQALAEHLVNDNVCLVFEIIDPLNDPHIVKYDKSDLILLSEIKLTKRFEQVNYEQLCDTAKKFGFNVKERVEVFNDWESLKSFLDKAETYEFTKDEEGWVLEDANGYHFKLKCGWYKFWKEMRYYKQKLAAGRPVSTSGLQTPLMNKVFAWMKSRPREWLNEKSIIDIRDEYEKESGK